MGPEPEKCEVPKQAQPEQLGLSPAPWRYQEESDVYTHIVRDANDRMVSHTRQDTSGRSEANARLIAAAPDLLAACVFVETKCALYGPADAARDRLRKAIAKTRSPDPAAPGHEEE